MKEGTLCNVFQIWTQLSPRPLNLLDCCVLWNCWCSREVKVPFINQVCVTETSLIYLEKISSISHPDHAVSNKLSGSWSTSSQQDLFSPTSDGIYSLVNSDAKMPQTSSGHVQTIDIHRFITTLEKISWISIKKGQKISPCHMASPSHQHQTKVKGMNHWERWKKTAA